MLGTDLTPYLRDVAIVVHLASVLGPMPDEALFTRVNVDGTRRVLDAATATGVRKIVRPSATSVYGAWANNPVPITEDAPLRPSPGYLPAIVDGECERLVAQWASAAPGRTGTRLRIAPIVGTGAHSLFTSIATGRAPVRVRGANPPVQVVHVDDAAAALELSTAVDLDGAYNVAADGWLSYEEAGALLPGGRLPALPAALASRVLTMSWATGLGDAPPALVPYLTYPFVVANDRLKQAGWKPQHSNDEALLLATGLVGFPARSRARAARVRVLAGAALATWWLKWRRRAWRTSRPRRA